MLSIVLDSITCIIFFLSPLVLLLVLVALTLFFNRWLFCFDDCKGATFLTALGDLKLFVVVVRDWTVDFILFLQSGVMGRSFGVIDFILLLSFGLVGGLLLFVFIKLWVVLVETFWRGHRYFCGVVCFRGSTCIESFWGAVCLQFILLYLFLTFF